MFELKSELHGRILIIRLLGSVLLPDAITFDQQLSQHLATPTITQAILDLSLVKNIDKAALGVLVGISTRYRGGGRRIVLLAPAPHVVQILKDAKIEGFFPTFESEEELKGTFS